jgi:hypothetical protein
LNPKVIASELLLESLRRHNVHLSLLVADTGLWVSPEFHHRWLRDTGTVAMFPNVRRARTGQGEQRNQVVDGIRIISARPTTPQERRFYEKGRRA